MAGIFDSEAGGGPAVGRSGQGDGIDNVIVALRGAVAAQAEAEGTAVYRLSLQIQQSNPDGKGFARPLGVTVDFEAQLFARVVDSDKGQASDRLTAAVVEGRLNGQPVNTEIAQPVPLGVVAEGGGQREGETAVFICAAPLRSLFIHIPGGGLALPVQVEQIHFNIGVGYRLAKIIAALNRDGDQLSGQIIVGVGG